MVEWRVGFGWFVAAWFEVLIGLQLAVFALGDPSGPVQRADPLRRLFGAEMIALPSVVIGIALGLTSIGILRGHLRKSVRPHRVVSGTLAIVGTAMTVSGMLAWLAPPSTADLKLEAQVWLVEESDIFQVLRRNGGLDDVGDIRPYGDQGTSDAAAGGIDQWVVVSVVEGDEGAEGYQEQIETLYGPTTAEAAWAYANRTLLYQGTQQELDAWAAEQGSTYKDRLTPSLLIWMGVLLIAAAFTLAPLRSTQELSDEDPR